MRIIVVYSKINIAFVMSGDRTREWYNSVETIVTNSHNMGVYCEQYKSELYIRLLYIRY